MVVAYQLIFISLKYLPLFLHNLFFLLFYFILFYIYENWLKKAFITNYMKKKIQYSFLLNFLLIYLFVYYLCIYIFIYKTKQEQTKKTLSVLMDWLQVEIFFRKKSFSYTEYSRNNTIEERSTRKQKKIPKIAVCSWVLQCQFFQIIWRPLSLPPTYPLSHPFSFSWLFSL